jgi:predicted amino acid dehydrogenase
MENNTRELDQIQGELDRLHERSQSNKANISAHEAVCEERYNNIILTMNAMNDEMKLIHKKVNEVTELATQGKTSLKTLLWLGASVAAVATFISVVINIFPR